MNTRIFYEDDADLSLINEQVIAIIGYGSQGAAHAQNLRDSGCKVVIGQREGGPGYQDAIRDGFAPFDIETATRQADIVNLLLPDEVHGEVFERQVAPHLSAGNVVMTCHGFSFHYGYVNPAPGVERLLVAPKGQGHMVRGEFLSGGGVPCLIAVDEGASDNVFRLGLAYAAALGGTKAGVIQTTIAAETETDLFGEQAVLCGGLTQLVQAGFDTLVDAGYQPELAYFECLHELKIIVDLLHTRGIDEMRRSISNTAEFGDYTRGPRIIDGHVRKQMQELLKDIQSGKFAEEFMQQHRDGGGRLIELRESQAKGAMEQIGDKLRSMMPWIKK